MITLNLIVQRTISLPIIGSLQTTRREKLLVCIVMRGGGSQAVLVFCSQDERELE